MWFSFLDRNNFWQNPIRFHSCTWPRSSWCQEKSNLIVKRVANRELGPLAAFESPLAPSGPLWPPLVEAPNTMKFIINNVFVAINRSSFRELSILWRCVHTKCIVLFLQREIWFWFLKTVINICKVRAQGCLNRLKYHINFHFFKIVSPTIN